MDAQEQLYTPLGLYVHVPFCATPCDYCAFYRERPTPSALERYVHWLNLEIRCIGDERSFHSIYFGGGTPGILGPTPIASIAANIHGKLRRSPLEWTVELSPNTVNEGKLEAWKLAGVNRISMGVQSFSEYTLRTLGRRQNPRQIFRAYELIRKAGFQNVGLDLIFSAPGQTISQFIGDLSTAISLNPEHISTYCLGYEEDTPLKNREGDGSEENRDSDFYEVACAFLESHGYQQYEISNFCRTGYASIHNINTWLMGDWIGIGPSASSQYGNERRSHIPSLERWGNGIESKNPEYVDRVAVDSKMLAIDKIIFGLRMNAGVDLKNNPHRENLSPFFQDLEDEGLLMREGSQIRLTAKGRLLCDAIAGEILNIS
jgi:oxygen-independent coproporphyrinogen-3 oxidase